MMDWRELERVRIAAGLAGRPVNFYCTHMAHDPTDERGPLRSQPEHKHRYQTTTWQIIKSRHWYAA